MPLYLPDIDRMEAIVDSQGIKYENYNYAEGTVSLMISGRVYFMNAGLEGGDLITNLHFNVTTAGITNTFIKGALLSKTGVKLAETADLVNGWVAAGIKVVPLVTPYSIPASDIYYVAVMAIGGTLPTLARQGNLGTAGLAIAPSATGVLRGGAMSSQTDIPDPVTIAAGTSPLYYWFAVS